MPEDLQTVGDDKNQDETKEWLQLDNESEQKYFYFTKFLELGPIRTVPILKEKLKENHDKKLSLSTLNSYCFDHDWIPRASAYDRHMSLLRLEKREDMILEMEDRHIKDSKKIQDRILEVLAADVKEMTPNKRAYFLDALTRAYERMVRLERLSVGVSTDRKETKNDGVSSLVAIIDQSKKLIPELKNNTKDEVEEGKVVEAEYEIKEKTKKEP